MGFLVLIAKDEVVMVKKKICQQVRKMDVNGRIIILAGTAKAIASE